MSDNSAIPRLDLNDLCLNRPDRPGWSLTFGATCAEAAAVCLDDQGHSASVPLSINGSHSGTVALTWARVDDTAGASTPTKKWPQNTEPTASLL